MQILIIRKENFEQGIQNYNKTKHQQKQVREIFLHRNFN